MSKKEKIEYVDDGRTLADMSGVREGASRYFRNDTPSYSSFREKWATFWMAFKLMLLPTLVVCLCLGALYLSMYLMFKYL